MNDDIIQTGEPVLRDTAAPVTQEEFGTDELRQTVAALQTALRNTSDGVAIAAPQVGISKCIFVVAGSAYDQVAGVQPDDSNRHADGVYINPEIVKRSKDTEYMDEGCLSVRNYFGSVPRATKVTVRAQTRDGTPFTDGRSGLLAQIFQHEIDHLDGILFTDKAQNIEYREPNENK